MKPLLEILKYEKFMLESNRIEGEDQVNMGDLDAVTYALATEHLCRACILQIHEILGKHLKEPWIGKFRTCQVYVGNYTPPPAKEVTKLVDRFCGNLHNMDSWEAHNEFERIHPFQDLNGRVGRLIWLTKAVHEGYNFGIPFLQMYYYQTLRHYEDFIRRVPGQA